MDHVTKELQRAGYMDWYDVWDDDDDSDPNLVSTLIDSNGDGSIDILDYYESVIPRLNLFGEVTLWQYPNAGTATGTAVTCTTNCDCVLYSYDLNEDGRQGVGASGTTGVGQNTASFELFGFRWNAGAIEQRSSGDSHDCNSGSWSALTDENVRITDFSLAMSYATGIGTGNDSTVYKLSGSTDWVWDGTYRERASCTPSLGTSTDTYDSSDELCLLRRNIDLEIEGELTGDSGVSAKLQNSVKLKNDFLNSSP